MVKEKDYEVLEGGDDSEDELSYSESKGAQEKIDSIDTEDTSLEEESQEEKTLKDEELRFKDGDDEWDKAQEGKEKEEEIKTEEEREVKEEGKEEKKEEEKELTAEQKDDKKALEDVLLYFKEEGVDTKYRVKGKEYDLRDLTPEEWKSRHSLAGRAYQVMEEAAEERKQIQIKEKNIEEVARNSQEIMRKYGEGDPGKSEEKLPEELTPHEDDTDEVKALKEMNSSLYNRVGKLESDGKQQDFRVQEQDLYRQLDSLEKEFPMLSKSEVVAVKSMPEFANADIRTIAENSHNNRIGDEYLDSVFKARPEKLREIEEKAIEKHLMKNPKVTRVSRKSSSTVTSGKVSSGKKKSSPRNWEEIEARHDEFKKGFADLEED